MSSLSHFLAGVLWEPSLCGGLGRETEEEELQKLYLQAGRGRRLNPELRLVLWDEGSKTNGSIPPAYQERFCLTAPLDHGASPSHYRCGQIFDLAVGLLWYSLYKVLKTSHSSYLTYVSGFLPAPLV